MDGARYLEDGKLTIFRRAGTYARLRFSPWKYVTRSLKMAVEETDFYASKVGSDERSWLPSFCFAALNDAQKLTIRLARALP
jgi:hypothetical protein